MSYADLGRYVCRYQSKIQVKGLPYEQWREELVQHLKSSPDNPLYPLLPFFHADYGNQLRSLPSFVSARTHEALAKLAAENNEKAPECPRPTEALIHCYLAFQVK